jgi:hypothetical protein
MKSLFKAELSVEQVEVNDHVSAVLERMSQLEQAPLDIGHLLRILGNETYIRYPEPVGQVRFKLRPLMTTRDVLLQLPILCWPPVRPGQCFHPECKQSNQVVSNSVHNQSHGRKLDFISDILDRHLD